MTALIDVLIYLSIIGVAMFIISVLMYFIIQVVNKIHRADIAAERIRLNRALIRKELGRNGI
jgi:cell shape-determining protein MreD